eukprot:m.79460 g.79460  ORF g.79460 m.79460 type:complete len:66 (-) comp14156_c1_seq6:5137-5334(-)
MRYLASFLPKWTPNKISKARVDVCLSASLCVENACVCLSLSLSLPLSVSVCLSLSLPLPFPLFAL